MPNPHSLESLELLLDQHRMNTANFTTNPSTIDQEETSFGDTLIREIVDFSDFHKRSQISEISEKLVDSFTFIGIEVELENIEYFEESDQFPSLKPYWKTEPDGSLRYGTEFILSTPLRGTQLVESLSSLQRFINKYDEICDPSKPTSRCGIHVHIDSSSLSLNQLKNFILIYLLFERMIFEIVSPKRYKNNNCRPLVDSEFIDVFFKLHRGITTSSIASIQRVLSRETEKYSAFNLAPLTRYGSVEFRHHESTKNIKLLLFWINIILSLRLAATTLPIEMLLKSENPIKAVFTDNLYEDIKSKLISPIDIVITKGRNDVLEYINYLDSKDKEDIIINTETRVVKSLLSNFIKTNTLR